MKFSQVWKFIFQIRTKLCSEFDASKFLSVVSRDRMQFNYQSIFYSLLVTNDNSEKIKSIYSPELVKIAPFLEQ